MGATGRSPRRAAGGRKALPSPGRRRSAHSARGEERCSLIRITCCPSMRYKRPAAVEPNGADRSVCWLLQPRVAVRPWVPLVARSRRPSSSRPATLPSRGASARLATLHIGRPFLRRRRAVIRAGLCPCPSRDSTRKDLRFAHDAVHVRAALGARSFHHPTPVGGRLVRILHHPLGLALDAVPLLRRRTWRCGRGCLG